MKGIVHRASRGICHPPAARLVAARRNRGLASHARSPPARRAIAAPRRIRPCIPTTSRRCSSESRRPTASSDGAKRRRRSGRRFPAHHHRGAARAARHRRRRARTGASVEPTVFGDARPRAHRRVSCSMRLPPSTSPSGTSAARRGDSRWRACSAAPATIPCPCYVSGLHGDSGRGACRRGPAPAGARARGAFKLFLSHGERECRRHGSRAPRGTRLRRGPGRRCALEAGRDAGAALRARAGRVRRALARGAAGTGGRARAMPGSRVDPRCELALGESYRTRFEVLPFFERGAIGVLQPDLGRSGITEARKLAVLADTHQVPVAPHVSIGLGPQIAAAIHFAAATPNLLLLECNPGVFELSARLAHDALEWSVAECRWAASRGWASGSTRTPSAGSRSARRWPPPAVDARAFGTGPLRPDGVAEDQSRHDELRGHLSDCQHDVPRRRQSRSGEPDATGALPAGLRRPRPRAVRHRERGLHALQRRAAAVDAADSERGRRPCAGDRQHGAHREPMSPWR